MTLTAGIADLNTSLTNVHGDDFTHCCETACKKDIDKLDNGVKRVEHDASHIII